MDTKIKFSKKELKMPEEQFGVVPPDKQPSFLGIILGLLILVLVVILGGLYLWGEELQKQKENIPLPEATRPTVEENNEPESNNAEADVETMQAMSTSDEIDAIEADLVSTNFDTLTNEIVTVEAILQE